MYHGAVYHDHLSDSSLLDVSQCTSSTWIYIDVWVALAQSPQ